MARISRALYYCDELSTADKLNNKIEGGIAYWPLARKAFSENADHSWKPHNIRLH
jgi:hypothetical protein